MNQPILRITAAVVFILPYVGALPTPVGPLSVLGAISSVLLAVCALVASFRRYFATKVPPILASYTLLVFLPAVISGMLVLAGDPTQVSAVLAEVALPVGIAAVVMGVVALTDFDDLMASLPVKEVLLAHFMFLLGWASVGFPQKFVFFASQKNVVGGASLAWLLVLLIRRVYVQRVSGASTGHAALFAAAVTVVASGSRTALGGAILAGVLVAAGQVFQMRRPRLDLYALGLFMVPFAYLSLGRLPFFEGLNNVVVRLTGNPIYSGREQLWIDALDGFGRTAIVGSGSSQSTVFLDGSSLHSHNLVLTKFYASGMLPALLLCFFLFSMARQSRRISNPAIGAAVLALVFHQLFEANFSVGGVPVGIALAFVVGVVASALNSNSHPATGATTTSTKADLASPLIR